MRPLDSAVARLERLGLLARGTPAPAWTSGVSGAPAWPNQRIVLEA